MRVRAVAVLALLLALAAQVAADDPLSILRQMYPGVKSFSEQERLRMVYGAPMTAGETPEDAAEAFWSAHGRIFRGNQPELTRRWISGPKDERFTVIAFDQTIRGTPVEGGMARIMVRDGRVVYAAGRLSGEPLVGVEQPIVSSQFAASIAQFPPGFGQMRVVGEPQRVVLRGDGHRPDAWAWKVLVAGRHDGMNRSVYVETRYGQVIHVADEFAQSPGQIDGVVTAKATPLAPPIPHDPTTNPPVRVGLPGLYVRATVNSQVYTAVTNENGEYSIPVPDEDEPFTIEVMLGIGCTSGGPQGIVRDIGVIHDPPGHCTTPVWPSTAMSLFESGTTPATVDFDFTDSPTEFEVAQVNAHVLNHQWREYFVARVSNGSALIPARLMLTVNRIVTFGAYVNQCQEGWPNEFEITFGASVSGQRNLAYSSVFQHEAGHALIWQVAGSPSTIGRPFHEGYAMSFANFTLDDRVSGRDAQGEGGHLLDDPTGEEIDCQYPILTSHGTSPPCGCDQHYGGQILAAVWLRTLDGYRAEFGNAAGLELARDLHLAWTLMTTGGPSNDECNSAYPGTLAEVLTLAETGIEDAIIRAAFLASNIEE